MRRIEAFLAEDEVEDWVTSLKRETPDAETSTSQKVGFENASFQWHPPHQSSQKADLSPQQPANEGHIFTLHDVSAEFPIGKLSLITGSTGSGKTSILNALLGGKMLCYHAYLRWSSIQIFRNAPFIRKGQLE